MAEPRAWAQAGVSDREAEVLRLVGAHLSNAQIARCAAGWRSPSPPPRPGCRCRSGCTPPKSPDVAPTSLGDGVGLAQAVADRAPSGEVWVTSTLRDLTAGSGLSFEPVAELDVPPLGRSVELDVVS